MCSDDDCPLGGGDQTDVVVDHQTPIRNPLQEDGVMGHHDRSCTALNAVQETSSQFRDHHGIQPLLGFTWLSVTPTNRGPYYPIRHRPLTEFQPTPTSTCSMWTGPTMRRTDPRLVVSIYDSECDRAGHNVMLAATMISDESPAHMS